MAERDSRETRFNEETVTGLSIHRIGDGAGPNIPKDWREQMGIEPVESSTDAKFYPGERKIELYF